MRSFIFSVLLLTLVSCASLYGVRSVKKNDTASINRFLSANNYSEFNNFLLKEEYSNFIRQKFKNDTTLIRYYLQPIQVLYYKNDSLVSYFVNCNAGGFPNLDWNKNSAFERFPPKPQTKTNRWFTFNEIKPFLTPVDQSSLNNAVDIKEFTTVVLYSLILERQSKNLIDLVRSNMNSHNVTTNVYLINMDNLFAE